MHALFKQTWQQHRHPWQYLDTPDNNWIFIPILLWAIEFSPLHAARRFTLFFTLLAVQRSICTANLLANPTECRFAVACTCQRLGSASDKNVALTYGLAASARLALSALWVWHSHHRIFPAVLSILLILRGPSPMNLHIPIKMVLPRPRSQRFVPFLTIPVQHPPQHLASHPENPPLRLGVLHPADQRPCGAPAKYCTWPVVVWSQYLKCFNFSWHTLLDLQNSIVDMMKSIIIFTILFVPML